MTQEHQPQHHEKGNERHLSAAEAREHLERLREHYERAGERSPDQAVERDNARHEAKSEAISGAEYHRPQSENRQHFAPTKQEEKELSFETTMKGVRANLSKPEQTLSKIIHQPVVEKVSEVAGKTIARPSGIAGATVAAFIGLLSVYGIAKFIGFELSGSEMPILLAGGFVAGLLMEWIFKALRSIFASKSAA